MDLAAICREAAAVPTTGGRDEDSVLTLLAAELEAEAMAAEDERAGEERRFPGRVRR